MIIPNEPSPLCLRLRVVTPLFNYLAFFFFDVWFCFVMKTRKIDSIQKQADELCVTPRLSKQGWEHRTSPLRHTTSGTVIVDCMTSCNAHLRLFSRGTLSWVGEGRESVVVVVVAKKVNKRVAVKRQVHWYWFFYWTPSPPCLCNNYNDINALIN